MLGALNFRDFKDLFKKLQVALATAHARSVVVASLSFLALTSAFGPRWYLQSFFDDASWLIAELQARGAWSLLTSSLQEERAVGLVLPLTVFESLAGDQPILWMIAQLLLHVLCGFMFMRLLWRQGVSEGLTWLGGLAWCFSPALIDAYLWPISLQHQLVLIAGFVLVEQAEVADRLKLRGFLLNLVWMLPLRPSILIFAWGVLPIVLWSAGRQGLARWLTWLSVLTLGQCVIALSFDGGWQIRSAFGANTTLWITLTVIALATAQIFRSNWGDRATQFAQKFLRASVLRVAALLALLVSSLLSQIGVLQLAELSMLASLGELAPPSVDFSRWQMIFAQPQASLLAPELTWSLIVFAAAAIFALGQSSKTIEPAEAASVKTSLSIARLWPWLLAALSMSFYLTRLALDPHSAVPQTEPLGVPSRYLLYVMPLTLLVLVHSLARISRSLEGLAKPRGARLGRSLLLATCGVLVILPWGLEPLRARARDTLFLDAFSSFPLEYALLEPEDLALWPKPDWSKRSDHQPFSLRALKQTMRHWQVAQAESRSPLGLPITWQMLGRTSHEVLLYPGRLGVRDFAELLQRLYPLHRHAPDPQTLEGQQALRYRIQFQLVREFAIRLRELDVDCTASFPRASSNPTFETSEPNAMAPQERAEICLYLAALQPFLKNETATHPDSSLPPQPANSPSAIPNSERP
jgi:hypothetical protein